MSYISSISSLACESIYKFPVTDTLYKKFFEFSIITMISPSHFISRIPVWTSSFDSKALFDRSAWTNYSNRELQLYSLEDAYYRHGTTFIVQSGYDHSKYMMITSIVQRFLELTSLSLKNNIDQQNWRRDIKYWAKATIDLSPYILMYLLGYAAIELFICKLFTILISNQIPYKASNFIREMDLISNDKCLKLIDFIKRNFLVMLRNLFVTCVLFEFVIYKIFPSPATDYFKDDYAQIKICIGNSIELQRKYYSSTSARILCFITDEFGWMLGKMLFDLVWAFALTKGLKVKDLRDPLRTDDKFKKALKEKIKNAAAFIEQPSHSKSQKSHGGKKTLKDHSVSFDSNRTVYMSWNKPVNLKQEVMQGHAVRKEKKKTHAPSSDSVANQDPQEERVPLLSFDHNVGNDAFTFVRLTGNSYGKTNTWGVIIKDSVKPGHLSRFIRSLSSGHIGQGSIKPLRSGTFELRPKALDARLIGRLHRAGNTYEATGTHTEVSIYNELQSYMPLEDARIVSEVLREEATEGEQTELIIFSKEAQKHGQINATVEAIQNS